VDPIAEDYPQLSSYNYAGNKPITSVDIEGLQGTEDGNGPQGGNDSVQADQLPDRNGMSNYLLSEVEVTGTHSFAEGETQSVPSAQINPVDGTATVDFQTYFYHRGLGEHDTESGWYSFSDYSERVFNAGKSEGYSDLNLGDASEPFYSDGRPLAENYEEKFSDQYEAGVFAGIQQRNFDTSGIANTTALEFDVMLAVATLGQGNLLKHTANKAITSVTQKSGRKLVENSTKHTIDDFVTVYKSQGPPKRAPKGGVRANGRIYEAGELMPGDELLFGRGTWTPPDHGDFNSLRPTPTRFMKGPKWVRYSVVGGGSALIIHWSYRKLTEE